MSNVTCMHLEVRRKMRAGDAQLGDIWVSMGMETVQIRSPRGEESVG